MMKKYIPILILSAILTISMTCNASDLNIISPGLTSNASDLNIISPGLREIVLTPPFLKGRNFQRNIPDIEGPDRYYGDEKLGDNYSDGELDDYYGFKKRDDYYGPDWVNGVAHSVAFSSKRRSIYGCGIQISLSNPKRTYIKSVRLKITYNMYAWAQKGDPAISRWDVLISPCYNEEEPRYPEDISDLIPRDELGSQTWCHYSEKAISGSKRSPVHRNSTRSYTVGAPAITQRNGCDGIRLWVWARAQAGSEPKHSSAGCRVVAEIESITLGTIDTLGPWR